MSEFSWAEQAIHILSGKEDSEYAIYHRGLVEELVGHEPTDEQWSEILESFREESGGLWTALLEAFAESVSTVMGVE